MRFACRFQVMDHPNIIKLFETFEDSWTLRVQDLLVLEEWIARDGVSTHKKLILQGIEADIPPV